MKIIDELWKSNQKNGIMVLKSKKDMLFFILAYLSMSFVFMVLVIKFAMWVTTECKIL